MPGMNRHSGASLSEIDHIRQSIGDILTTPIGTRLMRRSYGAHVFDLVDAPGNAVGGLRMVAAVADALERWEPRVHMASARVSPGADGRAVVTIRTIVRSTGEALSPVEVVL
ncbi:GPW/gp25 family protein [Telmatospirillum sp. J64-1]|uniref:GPW/gp25 family protein n=1 Tax=Telmatospirillum sp. J64-1 TaxID=2502183 RepID=UPI00115F10DA|nr:GPW/gp25 family protein [Telmatospirillum sp. J64-1]